MFRGLPNGHWWWGETRVRRVYYTEGHADVNARVKPAIIQFTDVGPVRRISNSECFVLAESVYNIENKELKKIMHEADQHEVNFQQAQ